MNNEAKNTSVPGEGSVKTKMERSCMLYRALKMACRIHTNWIIARYLMSHEEGRHDGAEKAQRHIELCQFYVAVLRDHDDPDTVIQFYEDEFHDLHSESQDLTDRLDETIGFPLKGRPDYTALEPLFFERFHAIAMRVLVTNGEKPSASSGSE